MKFTHLHVHSHYSLLDGLAKIDDLVKRAGDLGFDALALTDHGVLYGAIEFYQKARRQGINPIIGCEIYIAGDGMRNKRPGIDDKRFHLTVLAENYTGYRNLIELATKAHLEGFYYKPRVDHELLHQHSPGLMALSGCLNGEIPKAVIAKDLKRAEALIREYQEIFGPENFYLELGAHPNIPEQKIVNDALIELSGKTGAKIVGTNDIHYLRSDDAEAQDILVSVQTGNRVEDEDRLTMKADDFSMKSAQEMADFFRETPQAIAHTQEIAERTRLEIPLGKILLPPFQLPHGISGQKYLEKLCREGLAKRYGRGITESQDPEAKKILERLKYELQVIHQTGFTSYFLIVQDFVNWARIRGIVVGPGRGSAAGSLVSYVLGITNIDPLKYNLLFERFLNPERIAMPDIDLDFSDRRRDEVIEYVAQKYGRGHVAQIITFGTMAARAAIRDTGRALGMPYSFCDMLAKLIPFHMTLHQTLEKIPEFRQIYESRLDAKRLIDHALKLEGVARHASTHACGVVIAPEALINYVPLQLATKSGARSVNGARPVRDRTPQASAVPLPAGRVSNGENNKVVVTQYEMHAIEDLGLLKIDLLGLRNLTIIEDAVKLIKENHGIALDIDAIPLDDKETYRIFREGKTNGVFQFESDGMKRYLKELKPTELEDLIAMVSLYRPGPMELIPSFIARKHGREKITYLHPKLEPILAPTYGIGVYQEQMMQIARDLAGFTLPEADTLRKAIGKKIKSLLEEQKEKLLAGMAMSRIDDKIAQAIWELFPPFARYGFNRCLAGDTTIMDPASGRLISLQELYRNNKEKPKEIFSLESSQKIRPQPIADVVYNGRKPVWNVTTRSGRTIRATANHPFLTPAGWRKLEEIGVGAKLAVPRIIPEPRTPLSVESHKLGLLGYLLAEGNFCHPAGFYFYSKNREEIDDYLRLLERFSNTVGRIDASKPAIAVYAKRKNPKRIAGAVWWIKRLGLKYKKATEKFFPDFVYRLPHNELALLLGKMFQGDGCINLSRRDPQIFYATSSPAIARGLQHLLLRFGIFSTIHEKKFKYRRVIKTGYTITINRYDNIGKFIQTFGSHFVGEKAAAVQRIAANHPILNGSICPWAARGSYDTIPVTLVRERMRSAIKSAGLSFADFAWQNDISERLFGRDLRKTGYLRETVALVAERLSDQNLTDIAKSDIYWDEIAAIEQAGEDDTYDLTVDETHNFVANDIIVHNSHAACYTLIAYQTAYLKAHWPAEFMASLMTAEGFEIERIAFLVEEVRNLGMAILPPGVNASNMTFTVADPGEIRFGLGSIKNVGSNVVEAIIASRQSGGAFRSIDDFITRVQQKDPTGRASGFSLNKKSLEALIKCGAMDELGERNQLLKNLDKLLDYSRDMQRTRSMGQTSLFDSGGPAASSSLRLDPAPPADKRERLSWEKELLGLYISEHPMEEYREKLKGKTIDVSALREQPQDSRVAIGGLVAGVDRIVTKAGSPMLFVKLEDLSGRTEVLVFPRVLEKTAAVWQPDKILLVKGRVSRSDRGRSDEPKVLCDEVIEVV